jgi:hypothetical protein
MFIAMKAFGNTIDDLLLAFLIVASAYFYGLIWWNIFHKAGYRPTNGLLMYIPFINLVVLASLAFKEWPFSRYEYMRSLRSAIWSERKGELEAAIDAYENGIGQLRTHIETLKAKTVQDEDHRAYVRML